VRPGDRWLLCSDGLCGVTGHDVIEQVMIEADSPAAAVQSLVGLADAAGSPDNVTVVVVDTGVSRAAQDDDVGADPRH